MFPTISEYNRVIQSYGGNAFKTLSNLTFIPSRTVPVKIYSYGSGSYAVVFKAKDHFSEYAIRCFISAEQENIDRYRKIYSHLKNIKASWITKIQLFENEINIGNNSYPVIKMDWIEGKLLNNYITQVINNNKALTELQNEIVSVSKSLEYLQIGHGDIQCGNIIVVNNDDGKIIIKLIDYDGMYIPLFLNKNNLERGRTEFQHPNRSKIQYNEKVDRFSFWVILCAIEALKFDKSLWAEVMSGGFNTLDNLLFLGDDFKNFNNSKLVKRLYSLNIVSLNFYLDKLDIFCKSSPEIVENPFLFDSVNHVQPIGEKYEFSTHINNTEIQILTNPNGAAVLTSTFKKIGNTPIKIDKEKYLNKTLIVSYGTQIKQVQISQNQNIIDLTFLEPNNSKLNNYDYFKENIIKNSQNETTKNPINDIPSTIQSESDNSILIFIFVAALLVLISVLISTLDNKNKSNIISDSSSSQSSIIMDTSCAICDTSIDNNLSTVDSTPHIQLDTVSSEPFLNPINDTLINIFDDNNLTAQEVITNFLGALNNSDCETAWSLTYNPIWESKGKDWFCSYESFGGVTKTYIEKSYTISQDNSKALLYVHYYTEDSYNGNNCYKQNITINKIVFSDNLTKWMITKMKNIEPPYPCEFTQ